MRLVTRASAILAAITSCTLANGSALASAFWISPTEKPEPLLD